jgi:hypothetical protein
MISRPILVSFFSLKPMSTQHSEKGCKESQVQLAYDTLEIMRPVHIALAGEPVDE